MGSCVGRGGCDVLQIRAYHGPTHPILTFAGEEHGATPAKGIAAQPRALMLVLAETAEQDDSTRRATHGVSDH
jgi:hypothetical protein